MTLSASQEKSTDVEFTVLAELDTRSQKKPDKINGGERIVKAKPDDDYVASAY